LFKFILMETILQNWQPKKYIKSVIYGGLDGIITIFAMVASTSGASLSTGLLLVIGCANLFADAFSMSVSDYLSSKAEADYQMAREKKKMVELEVDFEKYKSILREVYLKRGYSAQDSTILTNILSKDKRTVVEILLHEDENGEEHILSPSRSALWTFGSFVLFGFLPLVTYIVSPSVFTHYQIASAQEKQSGEFWTATILTCFTLCGLGVMKAKCTEKEPLAAGLEMLFLGGSAAVMAFAIAWGLS